MKTSGRLLKWDIELSKYDIVYKPRVSIKAQALSDFIVETSYTDEEEDIETWKVLVDGSAASTGSGAGILLTSSQGDVFEYAIKFKFKASNNEAEYEAAIAGVHLCIAAEAKRIELSTNSQLVASKFSGEYKAQEQTMIVFLVKLKEITATLEYFEITLVPRAQNPQADALEKLASSSSNDLERTVMVEILYCKSIEATHVEVNYIDRGREWYDNILAYKLYDALLTEKLEAHKVKKDSIWFVMFHGGLYKRGFSLPLRRCITAYESARLIEEIHESECGNHVGGRSMSLEAMKRGYYWPTMNADLLAYAKKCDKCQKFGPAINQPPNDLTTILNQVPFAQWGMNIVGPFTSATGGRKFLIVGVDYFIKWIEAEPVAKITANEVKRFIWKSIFTRFGLPMAMVFDHGSQFDCSFVKNFLSIYKVKFSYVAVRHPQSNGQAEAANKKILSALKKKVEDEKRLWANLVPMILWANNDKGNNWRVTI
ncbi:uncharacterized protein LOC110717215 [Chenopodium quinoa]|uniref:uncharacterized protein LOC110717215 n=1 Tax=Chenopodium quinoa TaxID=63459 RepID=UPI000B77B12D|nr:uncharacterized protein LOC110717215 [Chenopodium quinoa]